MPEVYVFWTEHHRPEVQKWKGQELKRGRLRQGWGGPDTQLIENGEPVSAADWCARFAAWVNQWNDPAQRRSEIIAKSQTRFEILSRMLRMQPGDLLVVPHLPETGKITLVTVGSGYGWNQSSDAPLSHQLSDFGHYVSLELDGMKTVDRTATLEARILAEKFSNYQSAITRVANKEYAQTAWRLFRGEDLHPL